MKIAILSDTHRDAWRRYDPLRLDVNEKADVCLFAGDAGNDSREYHEQVMALKTHFKHVFSVKGNHDYYFSAIESDFGEAEVDGVKFAWATLWTDFGGDWACMRNSKNWINDFRHIDTNREGAFSLEPEEMVEIFNEHVEFLKRSKADVIMTHFAPFLPSIAEKYDDDELNRYFVNDLNPDDFPGKLWVHGHTHTPFDYQHGKFRVVSNPIGYPGENQRSALAKPMIVEI